MLIAGNETEGIGLGTAQFAFRDRTAEDSVATVHAALDAGVMLIDTALAYTRPGVESYAEQVVAHALRGLTTGRPLVATKGGHWRRGDSFPVDERPDTLRVHCEISLRTLETDRIDLYQLHHVDSQVPLPDSVGALGQLRQEGKIAAPSRRIPRRPSRARPPAMRPAPGAGPAMSPDPASPPSTPGRKTRTSVHRRATARPAGQCSSPTPPAHRRWRLDQIRSAGSVPASHLASPAAPGRHQP
jgi:hypothetical protein